MAMSLLKSMHCIVKHGVAFAVVTIRCLSNYTSTLSQHGIGPSYHHTTYMETPKVKFFAGLTASPAMERNITSVKQPARNDNSEIGSMLKGLPTLPPQLTRATVIVRIVDDGALHLDGSVHSVLHQPHQLQVNLRGRGHGGVSIINK